jgi:uncharacterized membrane protein YfcA
MVLLIIGILAIIQSLFGVGVLLFGTPILLFMGLDFSEVLLYLLPASASLSWIQVFELRNTSNLKIDKKEVVTYTIPFVFLGMSLSVVLDLKNVVTFFVFIMLIFTFLFRQFSQTKRLTEAFFRNHLKLSLSFMGLIHGLSNMGGSLLAPIMGSLEDSKKKTLALVSFSYALMASFQLIFILLASSNTFQLKYLISIPLVIFLKQTIGNSLLEVTKERVYQNLINAFIFLNAIVIAIKLF